VRLLRQHRQWAILIAAAAVLLVVAGIVSLTIVEQVSKGPAFQTAADYVRASPVARRQLGVITGFGLAVSGPVADAADGGTANIVFDVHGSWRSGHVRISAVKNGSDWKITNGVLTVDGERFRLPCAQTSSITACRLS
jgi:hypothetical protein